MSNRPVDTITTLTIDYTDAGGDTTQRGVSVTAFDPYEMFGFCHLRERYRSFLHERVTTCVDVNTGELVSDTYKHLLDIWQSSPGYSLDEFANNKRAVLQILVYVGKADGRLTAAERKVMTAACKVLSGDLRITDEMTAALFRSTAIPALSTFKRVVGSIANGGDQTLMKRLLIACNTIVKTEKKVSAAEQEALDYMAKRFNLS